MTAPAFTHPVWRKSIHSGDNAGQCVEVALLGAVVGLRDSKDERKGPVLACTPGQWDAFIAAARDGTFEAS
jgi:hypothetical protein